MCISKWETDHLWQKGEFRNTLFVLILTSITFQIHVFMAFSYPFFFPSSFKNVIKSQIKKSLCQVPLRGQKIHKADPISLEFPKFKSMYLKHLKSKRSNKQTSKQIKPIINMLPKSISWILKMYNIQRPCPPLLIWLISAEICLHINEWRTGGNTGFKQTEEYRFFKLSVNVEEHY